MANFIIGSEVWDAENERRGRVQGITANGDVRVGWRDGSGSEVCNADSLTPMRNGKPVEATESMGAGNR